MFSSTDCYNVFLFQIPKEIYMENEELFFLLIHNTLIDKMDKSGIPPLEITQVMKEVFGNHPNLENLRIFFNNKTYNFVVGTDKRREDISLV